MVYKWRQGSDLAAQSHCPVYMACGLCGVNRAYGSMCRIYVSNFPLYVLMWPVKNCRHHLPAEFRTELVEITECDSSLIDHTADD